jgi:hypothetical protein
VGGLLQAKAKNPQFECWYSKREFRNSGNQELRKQRVLAERKHSSTQALENEENTED